MNANQRIDPHQQQSATTERKARGRRARIRPQRRQAIKGATANPIGSQSGSQQQPTESAHEHASDGSDILNGTTIGEICSLRHPARGSGQRGPRDARPRRGEDRAQGAPVKVQVAAWLKIGRSSGTEYLSLKVGNNNPEEPETYTVGPFYGRLFRQVEGTRTRYFGFIEEAEKTGRG